MTNPDNDLQPLKSIDDDDTGSGGHPKTGLGVKKTKADAKVQEAPSSSSDTGEKRKTKVGLGPRRSEG
jgi:hypothetical protein